MSGLVHRRLVTSGVSAWRCVLAGRACDVSVLDRESGVRRSRRVLGHCRRIRRAKIINDVMKFDCEPFQFENVLFSVHSAKPISTADAVRHARDFCEDRKKKFPKDAFVHLPSVELSVDETGKVSNDVPTPRQLRVGRGLQKNRAKLRSQVLRKLK